MIWLFKILKKECVSLKIKIENRRNVSVYQFQNILIYKKISIVILLLKR